jgi:hypothetical protein
MKDEFLENQQIKALKMVGPFWRNRINFYSKKICFIILNNNSWNRNCIADEAEWG